MMDREIVKKLSIIPMVPGVYFFKDSNGEIIYIGKAAKLRNRVRQYFQTSRKRDPKTSALIREIADIEWLEVETELDAIFLEAELIRRYLPRYNILLRDDKALVYIRINYDSDYPTVDFTRRPLDDGARYFGPYSSVSAIRQALKYLRKAFPYATKVQPNQKRANLHYHLGLDPGLEDGKTSLEDYRANLRKLMGYLSGKRVSIISELERDMKRASNSQDFEKAAHIRDQLMSLRCLTDQIGFSDKEFGDISKEPGLRELAKLFNLVNYPRRIEGYDISHMQGTDVVASMVVFTNGVSNKTQYRKFKTKKEINNDFFNMQETIRRRLKHLKDWGVPDLILIDGGKGQLDAALKAREEIPEASNIPFIGLAKREEQIVIESQRSKIKLNHSLIQEMHGHAVLSERFILITLPRNSNVVKLLQRVRDESHRFAVSYHSTLKTHRMTVSSLEDIPGIGPQTRKQLIKRFGSVKGILGASEDDLVAEIGPARAKVVKSGLNLIS